MSEVDLLEADGAARLSPRPRRHAGRGGRSRARPLGGGISNTVLLAVWDGGGVVVKQPLAELAVEDRWAFDIARVFIERDCLAVLAERLPGSAPEVVFSDDGLHLLGMTVAPEGGIVWREEHDAGIADPAAHRACGPAAGGVARGHGRRHRARGALR